MAKSITAETVEAIVTRVMEKFTDVLAAITTNLTAVIRDTFNAQLAALNARLDNNEGKIAQFGSNDGGSGYVSTGSAQPPGSSPSGDLTTTVVYELLKYEQEKEDIRRRTRNVIVTGLPQQGDISDLELVDSFCENFLTVKPHIVGTKRIGKDIRDPNAKLCVTLERPEAVDDIISSATILRRSTDSAVKRVYFNRDLTKQQADAAYKLRCERRHKKTPPLAAAVDLQIPAMPASVHASAASLSF